MHDDRAQNEIRRLMKENNLVMYNISERLGEVHQLLTQQMRVCKDFKVNRFTEILNAMGYDLEIKKLGYIRVSGQYLDKLRGVVSGGPNELFYSDDDGVFRVCDNRDGKPKEICFASEEEMKDWLEMAAC